MVQRTIGCNINVKGSIIWYDPKQLNNIPIFIAAKYILYMTKSNGLNLKILFYEEIEI